MAFFGLLCILRPSSLSILACSPHFSNREMWLWNRKKKELSWPSNISVLAPPLMIPFLLSPPRHPRPNVSIHIMSVYLRSPLFLLSWAFSCSVLFHVPSLPPFFRARCDPRKGPANGMQTERKAASGFLFLGGKVFLAKTKKGKEIIQ